MKVARAQARTVNNIMKTKPQLVAQIFDFAKQLSPASGQTGPAMGGVQQSFEMEWIPEKYYTWSYCSVRCMQKIISDLEPIACDMHRLRTMNTGKDVLMNRHMLQKMFEQATGEHSGKRIGCHVYKKKLAALRQKYAARGSPLSKLVLPQYNPETEGVYGIRKKQGE